MVGTGSEGRRHAVRLVLALLAVLAAVALGGTAAQGRAWAPSPTAISTSAATTQATAAAVRSAVGPARSSSAVGLLVADQQQRPAAPAPVGVEASRPGVLAPTLLGQLPRPPSVDGSGTDTPAPRGRGPPATAGT